MKFCSECGAKLGRLVPPDDDRERDVCPDCGVVHYVNPRVIVVAYLYHDQKLLWTKRGAQPKKGKWAFPGGFLEGGETLQEAAVRELFEETRIRKGPKAMIPMSLGSVLIMNQLYIVFRCSCEKALSVELTAETEDWGWYSEDEAPWQHMAFQETTAQVHQVYQWLREGRFAMRVGEISDSGGDFSIFPLSGE